MAENWARVEHASGLRFARVRQVHGARVVRLDTNERLGRTPLKLDVRRKEATVWLEMALDGWHPIRFAVDLRKDNTANVEFKKASHRARAAAAQVHGVAVGVAPGVPVPAGVGDGVSMLSWQRRMVSWALYCAVSSFGTAP